MKKLFIAVTLILLFPFIVNADDNLKFVGNGWKYKGCYLDVIDFNEDINKALESNLYKRSLVLETKYSSLKYWNNYVVWAADIWCVGTDENVYQRYEKYLGIYYPSELEEKNESDNQTNNNDDSSTTKKENNTDKSQKDDSKKEQIDNKTNNNNQTTNESNEQTDTSEELGDKSTIDNDEENITGETESVVKDEVQENVIENISKTDNKNLKLIIYILLWVVTISGGMFVIYKVKKKGLKK